MKNYLVFILLLSVFHIFSQNDKTTFLENFDKTGMETSILYLIPTDLDAYKNESANMYNFYQIYPPEYCVYIIVVLLYYN